MQPSAYGVELPGFQHTQADAYARSTKGRAVAQKKQAIDVVSSAGEQQAASSCEAVRLEARGKPAACGHGAPTPPGFVRGDPPSRAQQDRVDGYERA